jgi:nicotinate-nucleotide adenylyltransferase
MVELAVSRHPQLKACDVEFSLPVPSYTVNTLQHLRTAYPSHNFNVIMGSDNLAGFNKWKDYEEILQHHQLLVYYRFGFESGIIENHPNVRLFEAPILHISATFVRDLIQQKAPISFLVPAEVEEYIKENKCFEGL